ncbi:NAD(P)-binding protein [Ectobacillus funiculus]|uniref:NAD(P)-binding protein n=1 Tax=Ectobacillus funiculus TaxID=137993 RepID=UPI00101BBED5|nr:NAD(P)-binding protein [Ectobacillus funiculus]
MYPLTLHIQNKRVVVVGGGKVALFKIGPLVREGADVTVISPEADGKVQKLAEEGHITWLAKTYEESDLVGALLIIAATDDAELNTRIAAEAGENQLVNVITDPTAGNVHLPAAFERGRLMIAVSTGGASPKLAKKIRDDLSDTYGEEYEQYLDFLYECRIRVKASAHNKAVRNVLLQEVLKSEYIGSLEKQQQFLENL